MLPCKFVNVFVRQRCSALMLFSAMNSDFYNFPFIYLCSKCTENTIKYVAYEKIII